MLVATSPSGFLIVPPLATLVFKLFVVGDTPGLKPGGWGAGTGRRGGTGRLVTHFADRCRYYSPVTCRMTDPSNLARRDICSWGELEYTR